MAPAERYLPDDNYWCCGECHRWHCADCGEYNCSWFDEVCRSCSLQLELQGKHGIGRTTYISRTDADLIQFRWCVGQSRDYEQIRRDWWEGDRKCWAYLGRVVLERKLGRPIQSGWDAHHMDGKSVFNNTRRNLIELPKEVHQLLARTRLKTTSRFRGVTWRESNEKWQMRFMVGGVKRSASYNNEKEAALAWDALTIEVLGQRYPDLDLTIVLNYPRHWFKDRRR